MHLANVLLVGRGERHDIMDLKKKCTRDLREKHRTRLRIVNAAKALMFLQCGHSNRVENLGKVCENSRAGENP